MFPGAGATVYRNEDGEPIGWDNHLEMAYEDRFEFEPDFEPYDGDDEDEDEDGLDLAVAKANFSPPNGWRVERFDFGYWSSEERMDGQLGEVIGRLGADSLEEGAELFYTLLAGNGVSYEITPAPEGEFVPRKREDVLREQGFDPDNLR